QGRRAVRRAKASAERHRTAAARRSAEAFALRHADVRSRLCQDLAQHGPVAPRLVFAVAADAEVGLLRQRGEEREQALRRRRAHLGAEAPRELRPARVAPRFRDRPRQERAARREVRRPQIVVVEPRVIRFPDAARRTPHRAEPQSFAACARRPQPDDADHRLPYSASVTASIHFVPPPKPTLICTSGWSAAAPCQCATSGPAYSLSPTPRSRTGPPFCRFPFGPSPPAHTGPLPGLSQ